MGTDIALRPRLSDVLGEYLHKSELLPSILEEFVQAGDRLKNHACVAGFWGNTHLDTGHIHESDLARSLRKSAWRYVYKGYSIDRLCSPKDKRRFEQLLESPPDLTMENLREAFGDFIADPRGNILRALAEVFADLDPAFKSHEKVKIGVAGLPKRVIIRGFGGYSSWGRDTVESILNAMAGIQEKPLVTPQELHGLIKDGDALAESRGVRLSRFKNGNGHLYFEPWTLKDVNRALAEYYGPVLADCHDDEPKGKKASTAVSADLQYYPTPAKVAADIVDDLYIQHGDRVLEPSCGCGRFMDPLRAKGATVLGIEVDPGRAAQCRASGHDVLVGNFLETVPTGDFDRVVMNPPFYGQHYAKHVLHALNFLKPGGVLTAILPVTAKDHGLVDGQWRDLPVGTFRESGTNINTTILTIKKI